MFRYLSHLVRFRHSELLQKLYITSSNSQAATAHGGWSLIRAKLLRHPVPSSSVSDMFILHNGKQLSKCRGSLIWSPSHHFCWLKAQLSRHLSAPRCCLVTFSRCLEMRFVLCKHIIITRCPHQHPPLLIFEKPGSAVNIKDAEVHLFRAGFGPPRDADLNLVC